MPRLTQTEQEQLNQSSRKHNRKDSEHNKKVNNNLKKGEYKDGRKKWDSKELKKEYLKYDGNDKEFSEETGVPYSTIQKYKRNNNLSEQKREIQEAKAQKQIELIIDQIEISLGRKLETDEAISIYKNLRAKTLINRSNILFQKIQSGTATDEDYKELDDIDYRLNSISKTDEDKIKKGLAIIYKTLGFTSNKEIEINQNNISLNQNNIELTDELKKRLDKVIEMEEQEIREEQSKIIDVERD